MTNTVTEEEAKVSDEQLRKMEHALGLTRSDKSYRNYYYAEGDSIPDWEYLTRIGMAEERRNPISSDRVFVVTEKGKGYCGLARKS